jgi:hypothetical protein
MSNIDSLQEAKRGIGVTCQCGKPARITARGRTLCYGCFNDDMGDVFDPAGYAKQRMRERVREFDRMRDAWIPNSLRVRFREDVSEALESVVSP